MKAKKSVVIGFMIAIALALQVFEAMLPQPMPIPGGKLGLANIVTLVVMVSIGGKAAIIVAVLRAALGSMLYGGAVHLIYSVAGALGSALLSAFLYKKTKKLSLSGIGVMAALCHNFMQVVVAAVLMGNIYIFTYYPILMLVSVPSGIVTGLVAMYVLKHNLL